MGAQLPTQRPNEVSTRVVITTNPFGTNQEEEVSDVRK